MVEVDPRDFFIKIEFNTHKINCMTHCNLRENIRKRKYLYKIQLVFRKDSMNDFRQNNH